MNAQGSLDFVRLEAERELVRRLVQHGVRVGEPGTLTRPQIIRQAILDHHLDCAIVGRNPTTRKPETYAQCYERLFDEPLIPTRRRKSHAHVG